MKSINDVMQYYTPKQFYIMGMVVFAVVMVCNIISLNYYWPIKILSDKVSSIAMVIFNIGIFLFFYSMYLTFKASTALVKPTTEKELDGLIDEGGFKDGRHS